MCDKLIQEIMQDIEKLIRFREKQELAFFKLYGLGKSHAKCLILVFNSENGLTANELTVGLQVDKANVSRVIHKLLEEEYLCKDSETQKYKYRLILTKKGRELAANLESVGRRFNQHVALDEKELLSFAKVIRKVNEYLEKKDEWSVDEC